jgi:RimJ/RimL family protein N-acetyltransferase
VGVGVEGGAAGTAAELVLRPLARADFPLVVDWLARPHVAEWWGPPLDPAGVEKEFGPSVDGTDPTEVFVATEGGAPIGLVQIYRLADNPDYRRAVGVHDGAGVDLFVAEADRRGQGLGPRLIAQALTLIWAHYPEVRRAMAGPSVRNLRSHRAFERAGFVAVGPVTVPGEPEDELVLVCPRPTGPTGA